MIKNLIGINLLDLFARTRQASTFIDHSCGSYFGDTRAKLIMEITAAMMADKISRNVIQICQTDHDYCP